MVFKSLITLVLLFAAGFAFYRELAIRLTAINQCKQDYLPGEPLKRWQRVIKEVFLQSKIIKNRPLSGLAHALVFWAFLAFGLETLNHLSQAFIPQGILPVHGVFHDAFQSFVAIFAYAALGGIIWLVFRRFILRPVALGKELSWSSGLVGIFISLLMLTYLAKYYGLVDSSNALAELNWWLHTVVLCAFITLIPKSKHLHLVLGPFSVYYRNEVMGDMQPLDFEKEDMGINSLNEFSKSVSLATMACVECGRCLDHCPAAQTGKVLDPKQLVLNMRADYLDDPEKNAVGASIPEEWLWQCTSCGACAMQCPTGNDQPLTILELRRGRTSEGEFPETLRTMFDNLERSGNPWRYPAADASKHIKENEIPLHDGNQRILYWMGCMARYDDAYRKISLDFVKIMRAANVDFAVLKNEKCTGDAARRAGNEFAFQELAMENSENINNAAPDLIVSTCPHCLKSLNEYKTMPEDMRLNDIPIVHHSVFIEQLITAGKLDLDYGKTQKFSKNMSYHDACYLSRYLGKEGINAPREILKAGGAKLTEAENHGSNSFCCGAGGAQLFMEETAGTRVNHERTDQMMATGADTICTSCPFCLTMLKDGVGDKSHADKVQVLDIAQVVAAALKE
jgi:Fe-S oxidoreductase